MSNRALIEDSVHPGAVKHSRRLSPRRLAANLGASIAALLLTVALLLLVFGGAILNRYGKAKAERAFAEAHPGCVLRIGELDYAPGANRLIAQAVTLSSTNTTLRIAQISVTGVRWARLCWGMASLADVFGKASLDATNLEADFPQAHYEVRCARLRGSVPGSELIAESTDLRPSQGDEAFFAAHPFRTARFGVVLPECRVSGLAYDELLQGRSYRARSVLFSSPSFDALINRDKPPKPFVRSPLMVHEALASIPQPLQVSGLSITNGRFRYCERLALGAEAGVLTVGAVSLAIDGIANRGEATAAIQVRGQGDLMNAGTMKVQMSIPIASSNFSLHYSGSLSAMDLTCLDAFLGIAEHTRIKSGSVQEAAFEIDVTAGQARGRVRAIYSDLVLALLDKETGNEKGPADRVASFFTNVLKTRNANAAGRSGSSKEGEVNYLRRPGEEFQQFLWFALRKGVLDIISL